MPQNLTPETLEATGGPIAAGLLPAWAVTWVVMSQADLDAWGAAQEPPLPGPNLAIVSSMATRRLATARVVSPWPDGEDLGATLHHELGHAWISPLTEQLEPSPSAVMLEEQLVETLGNYLASLAPRARAAARRALASVVDACAPQLRARISARATGAATGAGMDPKMIMEALEALIGGDAEKCQEILKGLIASAAGGGAPPAAEPDDETAPPGEPPMAEKKSPPPGAPPIGAPVPAEAARVAARLTNIDGEHTRARRAADAAVGVTVRARLREVRAEGVVLPTNLEAELGKMTDLDAFEQRVADITAGRSLAAPGTTRARGAGLAAAGGHGAAPPPADHGAPAVVSAEKLRDEGADDGFIASYAKIAETDPNAAAGLLAGFRSPDAVQSRARLRSMGPTGRALRSVS